MLSGRALALTRRQALILGFGASVATLGVSTLFMASSALADDEDEATALFNRIRKENGLGPMAPDTRLEAAALYQAKRMASYQKMGHSVGWGNDFSSRLRKAGIRGAAAENVAAGQKDCPMVFKAWMNSKGHRRNMLDPEFAHYGLAWATSEAKPEYRYWAMVLGR